MTATRLPQQKIMLVRVKKKRQEVEIVKKVLCRQLGWPLTASTMRPQLIQARKVPTMMLPPVLHTLVQHLLLLRDIKQSAMSYDIDHLLVEFHLRLGEFNEVRGKLKRDV